MPRSPEAENEIKSFSDVHGAPVRLQGSRVTFEPARGQRAQKLQAKARELHEHMLEVGLRSATVVSIRPFPINPQGTHSGNYPLPPCAIGEKYVKCVIPCHEVAVKNNEYGEEDVQAVLAIRIAEDIKAQMNKNGYRGVVVYMGERDPLAGPDPHDQEMRNIKKELEEEEKLMIAEFTEYVQRANDAHNNGKGRQLINDLHRVAARYLMHKRRLTQQPAWLLETREAADVSTPCIACGAEPLTKDALQCKSCGTWLKPFEAAKAGLLSPSIDGGTIALQRCTKDQLIELGFYPHVKPTAEANADWLKAQKKQQ